MRSQEEITFWLAVNARPADPLPRLMLADWLDEHGRGYEAEALRWPDCVYTRNLREADRFLIPHEGSVLNHPVAAWQRFSAAWSLCRRAGVDPRGGYDQRRKSRWRIIAGMTISFALAQMPDEKRWDEKEQRKAVSAAYPFGERRFHPYKVWLSEVKSRLGPTYKGRTVQTEQRGLFEVAS